MGDDVTSPSSFAPVLLARLAAVVEGWVAGSLQIEVAKHISTGFGIRRLTESGQYQCSSDRNGEARENHPAEAVAGAVTEPYHSGERRCDRFTDNHPSHRGGHRSAL